VSGSIYVDGTRVGSGVVSIPVLPGQYTISFGAVSGYTTPAPQTVTVATGETKSATGVYTPTVPTNATLQISTSPVAGPIFVDGSGVGTGSAEVEVPAGQHTVSFGNVEGYDLPDIQVFTVAAGETRTVTGYYSPTAATAGTPDQHLPVASYIYLGWLADRLGIRRGGS